MKTITRIINVQITKIIKCCDDVADMILETKETDAKLLREKFIVENCADDVNLEIKDFVREEE